MTHATIVSINVNPHGGVPKTAVSAAVLGTNGVAGDKQRNLRYSAFSALESMAPVELAWALKTDEVRWDSLVSRYCRLLDQLRSAELVGSRGGIKSLHAEVRQRQGGAVMEALLPALIGSRIFKETITSLPPALLREFGLLVQKQRRSGGEN